MVRASKLLEKNSRGQIGCCLPFRHWVCVRAGSRERPVPNHERRDAALSQVFRGSQTWPILPARSADP